MSTQSSLSDLLEQCKGAFEKEFGTKPTIAAQAPGRVNIIGEHTDYNNGFVFPMAIPLYTVIVGKPNNSDQITIVTLSSDVNEPRKTQFHVPGDKNPLEPGSPKWANYMKGVVQHFPHKVQGFDCCVVSTVPLGGGLSSSASLEVATATFLEALTGNTLKLNEKALLCQKAEHTFAGMPCGIMDQFISCMGKESCALLIDCQSLDTKLVPLKKPDSKSGNNEIAFLVVNSNVKHELSGSEYPQRRSDCYEAAKIVGVKSLRDATINSLTENREKMNDRVYQRALHVVGEIERCTSAADAISNEDYDTLGRLMYQSHVSLRDLYAVSCAELDQLVDITMEVKNAVYGSRMTGGGFGGCIVALVKADQVDRVIEEINKKYSKKATTYVFTAVDGTMEIKL